jgi:uncharacterized metal-binding protein YceD (DUF177 family)
MKHNREFEIAWQGLRNGVSEYTFSISDDFMRTRGAGEEFKDWNAEVLLKFDKHESFFMLHFDISGRVTLPCDRCGDEFTLQLWDEFNLLVKLKGDSADEVTEDEESDVAFIPRSETVLDISPWIYEFVFLSVPLQRVHPDDAAGNPTCNPQALSLLNKLSEPDEAPEHNIWKGLEGLKEDNNKTNKRKTK